MSGSKLRSAARGLPTGVTIVIGGRGADAHGLTVNSFATLSLDPPLVSFCLKEGARLHPRMAETREFVVSILAEDQAGLALRFADPSRPAGFAGVETTSLPGTGGLVVAGAVGYFECRVRSMAPMGDHTLMVGEVTGCDILRDHPPLLFAGGRLHRLGSALA
ncbi:flavin reductase family protein [Nonomuraea cavernae]|uniref:flavin reductase family protein n=1 Tax=Nonomuraea cavernae TaxID=2045107 RepID=UPI00166B1DCF|nr:flavin reductase family protein [Nonomuraea cavernae]MCA2183588.1 flavin reductase family protein [Nonomuraea cavernae]